MRLIVDKHNQQEFYEEEVRELIDHIKDPSNYNVRLYIHDWIINNTKKGEHVLDVGCGSGILCYHLKNEGRHPTGIDLTKVSVDFCKDKIPGVVFNQGKAEKLPFQNGLFDVVSSNQLLEHLKEPKVAIKEMIRVCKPNGKLLV
ncbi:hypothetical protein LCGC14_2889000, partial [marine sediment metagenome]